MTRIDDDDFDSAFEKFCQLTELDGNTQYARCEFVVYLGWSVLKPSNYLATGSEPFKRSISSAKRKVRHLNGPNASVIFAVYQARRCKWVPKWCGILTAKTIYVLIGGVITMHGLWRALRQ